MRTMASEEVVATKPKQQPSSCSHDVVVNSAAVPVHQLPPEVLMAATRGDWRKLDELMSDGGGRAWVPHLAVDVDTGTGDDDAGGHHEQRQHGVAESALHVAASGGDGEEFLRSSSVIHGKAGHLLGARNAMGDTPLHCAARAGSFKMVRHLLHLLASGGGPSQALQLQAALRTENGQGETVLHEALRCRHEEMVHVLMSVDAELARFPRDGGGGGGGVSPLYLAILLGHDDLAEKLNEWDSQLSYSGPDGQNALHCMLQF